MRERRFDGVSITLATFVQNRAGEGAETVAGCWRMMIWCGRGIELKHYLFDIAWLAF
jgi:hypothetical protein